MTELDASSGHDTGDHGASTFSLVRRQLPFLAILALAIGGVAYTNISQRPLVGYWEFLAIVMGLVCVITQWSQFEDRQARFRLMWTQALHWLAVLVAMNIMLFSGVQQVLPTLATGLVLLIILALGTFLAGVHLLSLQIVFLGLALGLAVPAISLPGSPWRSGPIGAMRIRWPPSAGRPHFPISQRPPREGDPMVDR